MKNSLALRLAKLSGYHWMMLALLDVAAFALGCILALGAVLNYALRRK